MSCRTWLALVPIALWGCGVEPGPTSVDPPSDDDDHVVGEGPRARVRVWLEPGDLATDVASAPLLVRAQWQGAPPPSEVLDGLGAALSLTDAAGVTVPAAILPPAGDLEGHSSLAEVQLVPESPLEPGWYVLRADGLSGYEVSPTQRVAPAGSGDSMAVRFHVGSAAVVQMIQICRQGGALWTVTAELSERVRVGDALGRIELLRRAGPACSVDSFGDSSVPGAAEDTITSRAWTCRSIGAEESFDLVIPSGITALSGVAMAPTRRTFSWAEGIAVSTGCVVVRGTPDVVIPGYEAL